MNPVPRSGRVTGRACYRAGNPLCYKGPVRKLLLIGLLMVVAAPVLAPQANAAPGCDLPATRPLWIDFGDGSVPFWQSVFAKPGIIAAASNFLVPPKLRAAGARTVYWDMHLNTRVGTPQKPLAPAGIADQADRLFLRAVASSGCATPVIALNELFGAGHGHALVGIEHHLPRERPRAAPPAVVARRPPVPAGQQRALHRRRRRAVVARRSGGGRPRSRGLLLRAEDPQPGRAARQPDHAGRAAERADRFTEIGVPTSRLGFMLGFHTTKGVGSGREGLQPSSAWFDVVKLEALAAKQVAEELSVATVWSWGWGVWSVGESDPDKEAAACVWLWARDSKLCDGPHLAGEDFDPSRLEGRLPAGVQCALGANTVTRSQLAELTRLTGDPDAALSALQERLVLAQATDLSSRSSTRPKPRSWHAGSAGAGRATTRRSPRPASLAPSRGRSSASRRASRRSGGASDVSAPTSSQVLDWYVSYAAMPARAVVANAGALVARRPHDRRRAPGDRASVRPHRGSVREALLVPTATGNVRVRVGDPAMPLAAFPLALATPAISAALQDSARLASFEQWLLGQQTAALRRTVCVRDELPSPEPVDLTAFAPFLALG